MYFFRSVTMYSKMGESQYRLGSLLVSKGMVSGEQLDEAIEIQKYNRALPLGQILIDKGYLSERQLRKTLSYQSWMRKAACIFAFTLAPMHLAAAKDISDPTIMLPSWDQQFAADSSGFESGLPSSDELVDEAMPIYISLDEIRDAYRFVTGRSSEPDAQSQLGWMASEVSSLRYNVDLFASGGMRLNLKYKF